MKLLRVLDLKYVIAGSLCLLLNHAQAADEPVSNLVQPNNGTPTLNLPDALPPAIKQTQTGNQVQQANTKPAPKAVFPSASKQLAQKSLPSDVRILIDISGSMKETDPQNLRKSALKLLANLMPDKTRAGAWTFGRYVNMLVPLAEVSDEWKKQALEKADQINSAGLRTNLTQALERARFQEDAEKYQKSIILLTDGKIDMANEGDPNHPENKAARKKLINEILPFYAQKGIKIHTLALSDKADTQLLQKIALETDGLYLKADDPDSLPKIFLKAFERSVPVEQVPLDDNRFDIDESIKEFTALIFRKQQAQKETSLVQPDGKRINQAIAKNNAQVRWYKGLVFDLVTVKTPQAGKWSIDADLNPDNRVQILTDLSLEVLGIPSSLFSGNPVLLQTGLKNEGEVVTEKTLLQLTDMMLTITKPDGKTQSKLLSNPEKLPADGWFKEAITDLKDKGEYKFEIIANGRTFRRKQVITASLLEPIQIKTKLNKEDESVTLYAYPKADLVDVDLSRIILNITLPNGSSKLENLAYDKKLGAWQYKLKPENPKGICSIKINIRGVSQGGKPFRSEPEEIQIAFPLNKPKVEVTPEPQVKSEPEVKPETEAKPEPEAKPELEEKPEPETKPEPEVKPEPEAKPEPEVKPKPEAKPEPEVKPEPEPEVKPEPETKPETEVDSEIEEEDPFAEDEEESSGSIWIYLGIGITVLLLASGVFVWWLKNQKKEEEFSELVEEEGFLSENVEETREDPDLGSFDNFEGEEEVPVFTESENLEKEPEISEPESTEAAPASDDSESSDDAKPEDAQELSASTPEGESKTDSEQIEELDSSYDISPDEDMPDADGWGEFDEQTSSDDANSEDVAEPAPEEVKEENAEELMAQLTQENEDTEQPDTESEAVDAAEQSEQTSEETESEESSQEIESTEEEDEKKDS